MDDSSLITLAYGNDEYTVAADAAEQFSPRDPLEAYIRSQQGEIDWNGQFQKLLSVETSAQERFRIGQLSHDFACAATRICVKIVEEMYCEQKVIQPIAIGGVAGGQKYLRDGVFVKLSSRDWKGLYGGDANSIKSASRELLATQQYLDLRIRDLHVPLMALVLYRGHALLCQSVVPVSSSSPGSVGDVSLQHGSRDAGMNIRNESPALEAKLRRAATALNLAPHAVVSRAKTHARTLWTAADMEGHLGRDGRFYLLDCARAFPPCAPKPGDPPSAYLYRLLRPECVKRWKGAPLNPDAFSNFKSADASETRKHNENVARCTRWLEQDVVPMYAHFLDNKQDTTPTKDMDLETSSEMDGAVLTCDMHIRGINVRYLGLLLSHVHNPSNQRLILSEMVARVSKHKLFDRMRRITDQSDESIFAAVVDDWFERMNTSLTLWNDELKQAILSYFVELSNLSLPFFEPSYDLKGFLEPVRLNLNARISTLVGYENGKIVPRVKHLSRISFEQGLALARMGVAQKQEEQQKTYLEGAVSLFRTLKHDRRAKFNLALCLTRLARLESGQHALAYFEQCFVVLNELAEEKEDDYRVFFLLGSSQLECSKLSSCTNRHDMLMRSKDNLEKAVDLSHRQMFGCLYNLGNLYLMLVRHLGSKKDVNMELVRTYLTKADACFGDTLDIEPSHAHSMINQAVAKSKLARTCPNLSERRMLYEASFRLYDKASRLLELHSLHFDWANALYRFGKELLSAGSTTDGIEKLYQSCVCYAKSLKLRRTLEAWINLGVAFEKLSHQPTFDANRLLSEIELYASMEGLDSKRAAEVRQTSSAKSVSFAKVFATTKPSLIPLPLSPTSPPAEDTTDLKSSDDSIETDPKQGRPRRGSILTSFSKMAKSKSMLKVETTSNNSNTISSATIDQTIQPTFETYIAPETGSDFQGDTIM